MSQDDKPGAWTGRRIDFADFAEKLAARTAQGDRGDRADLVAFLACRCATPFRRIYLDLLRIAHEQAAITRFSPERLRSDVVRQPPLA